MLCDSTPCDVSSGGYCCLPDQGSPSCHASGNGCAGGETQVECDEPGDCPGQVCCGTFDGQNSMYTELVCADSCNGPGSVIICDGNGDCSGNDTCQSSNYLPSGYTICR